MEINGIISLISVTGVEGSSGEDDQEFISASIVEAVDITLKRFAVLEAASGDNVGYSAVKRLFDCNVERD